MSQLLPSQLLPSQLTSQIELLPWCHLWPLVIRRVKRKPSPHVSSTALSLPSLKLYEALPIPDPLSMDCRNGATAWNGAKACAISRR